MTPNEIKLTDAMATSFSKSAPDVAANLTGQSSSTCEGVITITERVSRFGTKWMLLENHNTRQMFWVSPETFRALELFAEQIGWRPQ